MNIAVDTILGILFSIGGLLIIFLAFKDEPSNEKSESTKSSNIQIKILGIGIFIGGLIYAF